MRKRIRYTREMPRRLYSFFVTYKETDGAPSFSKFARSIGATTAEIEEMRQHTEFDRAYRECSEIRRDYLIDRALCKKFDGSVTKFLLTSEFGMGEDKDTESDSAFDLTLTVLSEDPH